MLLYMNIKIYMQWYLIIKVSLFLTMVMQFVCALPGLVYKLLIGKTLFRIGIEINPNRINFVGHHGWTDNGRFFPSHRKWF